MAIVLGSLYLLLIVVVVVRPSKVKDNHDFRLQTSGSGSGDDQWVQSEPRRLAHSWDLSVWVLQSVEVEVAVALRAAISSVLQRSVGFLPQGPQWCLCYAKLDDPRQATFKYWGWCLRLCGTLWGSLWNVFSARKVVYELAGTAKLLLYLPQTVCGYVYRIEGLGQVNKVHKRSLFCSWNFSPTDEVETLVCNIIGETWTESLSLVEVVRYFLCRYHLIYQLVRAEQRNKGHASYCLFFCSRICHFKWLMKRMLTSGHE